MAIDERTRQELYRRLEEVLGTSSAAALMEHLPPVGWADVATKHDLAGLEQRMDLRFERADERLAGLEQRMDLRFERVDESIRASAAELRASFEHGLRSQTTAMIFALVSVVLTMAGFVHFA